MAKNVMKLLKPSPHRARNDFDLSHRHVFDANFGELLPATCIETVPGDNITLHASDLLRAIPFVSSPFLRAKQHLDVWFVPYHDLWHQFDAFITKKREPVSSAFKDATYCPWVSQNSLYGFINSASSSGQTDISGRNVADRSYYLLQLLGYGDILHSHGSPDSGSTVNSYRVNPFRLAAYNYIWFNEYRQQYYDDGSRLLSSSLNVAHLFNFDDLACNSVANANIASVGGSRIYSMCQMRYRCWKKDLFTGVLPSTQFGLVSTLNGGTVSGLSGAFTGQRTFLEGGVDGDGSLYSSTFSSVYQPVTGTPSYPLPVGGSNLPPVVTGSDDARHSHLGINDAEIEDSKLVVHSPIDDINNDYAVVYNSSTGGFVKDEHTHQLNIPDHYHQVRGSLVPQGTVSLNTSSGVLSFDILSLRHAEALQIWRENALRAGNHIKDNMLAHYGVASDFNDHRPVYLGSVSAPLNIGDIATTANSSSGVNDVVGDIAGKGLSSLSEKVFKFHAKDFGVIMVMFSMLPEAEYDALGIERTNQLLEQEDFFMPEFENLGLEPVDRINFGAPGGTPPGSMVATGYAPRYYGYKTKLDKCFGQFAGNGVFRTWTSQRSDVTQFIAGPSATVPLNLLYVNPAIYDANFNVGIANSPQFLCDVYFDVDAVRPMSVVGLPFS